MNAVVPQATDAERQYAIGRQLKARGDLTGAEIAYRAALDLQSRFFDAWLSLGVLLKQQGRAAEAEACYRKAIDIDPVNHLGTVNLGNLLQQQGNSAAAAECFLAALRLDPGCQEAHVNLGYLLLAEKRRTEAAGHFAAALSQNPRLFEAAAGLGEALLDEDNYQDALEPLLVANRLRPDVPEVKLLLGRALGGAGDYAGAARQFEAALNAKPQSRGALYGLATSLVYLGQFSRPRRLLKQAVDAAPDNFAARFAYATLLLRAGELREGWTHYHARSTLETLAPREFAQPRWQGEDLAGRTLLIAREQGLGDEIMFASLFAELIGAARHCIVECDPRLVGLYERSFPQATFVGVAPGEVLPGDLPPFDCWTRLGDPPGFLRNDRERFPQHAGYLRADESRVLAWRARLVEQFGSKPVVGISWRGGAARTRSGERSLSLEQLQPLLESTEFAWISLQYGGCADELEEFRRRSGIEIAHWQYAIDDLDEYAALVTALSLTLSVCSAVVHLSGALGRPAWVMAPLVPEWRYGREGETMPWYPKVRIFRQEKAREWRPVIAGVKRQRRRFAAAHGAFAEPS